MSERPRLFQLDDLDFVHYDSCGKICIKVKLGLSAWDSCNRISETEGYVDICLEDVTIRKIEEKLSRNVRDLVETLVPFVKGSEIEDFRAGHYDETLVLKVWFRDGHVKYVNIEVSTRVNSWLIRETAQLVSEEEKRRNMWKEHAREIFNEVLNDEEVRVKFVEFLRTMAKKMEEYGKKRGLVLARREEEAGSDHE